MSKRRISCGIAAALFASGSAFTPPQPSTTISSRAEPLFMQMQRREVIDIVKQVALGAAITGGFNNGANALDFDAFEKADLDKDTKECNPKLDPKCTPKLTPDEALCKYGVPGANERTKACYRVRESGGSLPSSKAGERNTAGWVNNPIAL